MLGLTIVEFHYFLNQEITLSLDIEKDMIKLSELNYAPGIFYFVKNQSFENDKNDSWRI